MSKHNERSVGWRCALPLLGRTGIGLGCIHGGWSFFQRALDAYDLPLDAEFVDRTRFSARLGAIHYLGYTLYHGGNPSRDLADVTRVFELE